MSQSKTTPVADPTWYSDIRYMFTQCENCVSNAIVHFDFELPLETVLNGELKVVVEPIDKSFVGERFSYKLMGNPTIDIHLLLKTE